jgi:hypothetical protein
MSCKLSGFNEVNQRGHIGLSSLPVGNPILFVHSVLPFDREDIDISKLRHSRCLAFALTWNLIVGDYKPRPAWILESLQRMARGNHLERL